MSKNIVGLNQLINIKEIAAAVGVSVHTVYGWSSRGKRAVDPFPVERISPRCIRFDPVKVQAWLDRRNGRGPDNPFSVATKKGVR